jgi:tRNA nucleotidyltransferase (CCA-adding enzyme)
MNQPLKISPAIRGLFRGVADLSARRGEAVYVVGGFVRDQLLHVESYDVDFAVEGDGPAFAEALAKTVGGRCEAFTKFGTALVTVPGFGKVDVASTRAESYSNPGALPDVVPDSLASDLVRRDFTLNSIAVHLGPRGKTEWIDPAHGQEDLRKGILRAHHAKTFEDDPTRIFRAVRFEQRFGFKIEKRTLLWLKEAVKGGFLIRVTGERIRNELRLIFAEPDPLRAVKRLRDLGVWTRLHFALKPTRSLAELPVAMASYKRLGIILDEPWMSWLALLADAADENQRRNLADRLMLSGVERKILFQCGHHLKAAAKVLRKKDVGLGDAHSVLSTLRFETRVVLWAKSSPKERRLLEKYEKAVRACSPFLSGKDLIDIGLHPGPDFAEFLEESYRCQLDKKLKTRRQALKWLEKKILKK